MDHQLHAAGFVEEAFEHDRLLRRQAAQRRLRAGEVVDELLGDRRGEPQRLDQPALRSVRAAFELRGDLGTQPRHRLRQLAAASRRLAQPERNVRRLAVRILDAHDAALDALDAIRRVAELEHVTREALDREVLVDRADEMVLRFEDHLVVGGVGNRAARGQRGEPRAAPAAQHVIDGVMVQQRAAAAAARAVAFGQHAQDRIEVGARQIAKRPGAARQRVERIFAPFLRRDLGHDLLRQHVERAVGNAQGIELAAAHRIEQGGALDQVVARLRKQPALGRAADRMAGAADALQKSRDRMRRTDLADQVDLADVDAQFERGGRHQRAQVRRA